MKAETLQISDIEASLLHVEHELNQQPLKFLADCSEMDPGFDTFSQKNLFIQFILQLLIQNVDANVVIGLD